MQKKRWLNRNKLYTMKDTIIKDHQVNENPPEMDFFAWPDTDMGKVFSGTSTKSINDSEKNFKRK